MFAPVNTDKTRLIQLDILRGVAILLVLGRHHVIEPGQAGSLSPLANLWLRFGWTGVDLFFVLSGFLVGGLLFKELRTRSRLDVRRFLVRRGFKIWPAYLVYIFYLTGFFTFLALVHSDYDGAVRALKAILPNYFHIQNYYHQSTPRLHTWSLAVEEHFYLALPLFLLVVTRRRQSLASLRAVPYVAVGLIILCTGLRCFTSTMRPLDFGNLIYPTHLRIDGLFFGVMLGYFYHFKPHILQPVVRYRASLLLLGVALISPMMFLPLNHVLVATLGLVMLYVGYGCILLVMLYTPVGAGLLGKSFASVPANILAFIGYFSYSIYLWHIDGGGMPLRILLDRGFLLGLTPETRWLCVTSLYVLGATAAGVGLGKLIERPSLAVRDRFFPARADALAQPQELNITPAILDQSKLITISAQPELALGLSGAPLLSVKEEAQESKE